MSKEYLVPIIMGSKGDEDHAKKIGERLIDPWGIPFEMRVASAHKTPDYVKKMVEDYNSKPEFDIRAYITVAGRSNGLSGMVAANTTKQVIACPPYSEKFAGMDILSSLHMPSGTPAAVILEPENAADFAARAYVATDEELQEIAEKLLEDTHDKICKADEGIRGVKRKSL